ncbi:MAG TPA: hypothetical protein PLQ35_04945 [bacterium]|nr:hypothetical protein [bacterium]HQL61621.1 hypothetical protein [bacterium]
MDDLLTMLSVIVGLLSFCVAGYIMAVTDFRPKKAIRDEELPEAMDLAEPVITRRELSLSELGINRFGDLAALPAEEQRRIKMEEHVREYSSANPQDVAGVIRSWLQG